MHMPTVPFRCIYDGLGRNVHMPLFNISRERFLLKSNLAK